MGAGLRRGLSAAVRVVVMRQAAAPTGAWKVVAVTLLLSSCTVFEPGSCTTEVLDGMVVEVVSAATGLPVTQGLIGTLVDGSYSESMTVVGNGLKGAAERAGNYTLMVRATGFVTWVREGIRVTEDECHVRTVELTVEMVPVTAGTQ